MKWLIWNMKKSILILFGLLLLISCKENKKSKLAESQINETELIVQKILDLPRLQWIYHPEAPERIPVKVLETAQIEKDLSLNKFGKKVRIMSRAELTNKGIKDFVEFDRLTIDNDTANFGLHYKVEGAGCAGRLLKVNGEWIVLDYSVWEN